MRFDYRLADGRRFEIAVDDETDRVALAVDGRPVVTLQEQGDAVDGITLPGTEPELRVVLRPRMLFGVATWEVTEGGERLRPTNVVVTRAPWVVLILGGIMALNALNYAVTPVAVPGSSWTDELTYPLIRGLVAVSGARLWLAWEVDPERLGEPTDVGPWDPPRHD